MGRKRVDKEKGVLFGVDYYPEQWDRSLWESDFRRMREMGFRSVRMMEFAWVLLEPRPGKFDFTLFDEAVDLAAANDLTVVLGTPTATDRQRDRSRGFRPVCLPDLYSQMAGMASEKVP